MQELGMQRTKSIIWRHVVSLRHYSRQRLETHHIGTGQVLVLDGKGTRLDDKLGPRDLARQLDGLGDGVLARLDGALELGVGLAELLADVEALVEQLDEAELDRHVGVGAVLRATQRGSALPRLVTPSRCAAHNDGLLHGAAGVDRQVLAGLGRIRVDVERLDLYDIRRQACDRISEVSAAHRWRAGGTHRNR